MALSRRGKGRITQSRERDETPTAVRTDNDVASGSAPLCVAVVLCVAAFVFTLFAGLALVSPALHLRLPHGLDTFLHSTTTTVLASTARSPSPKGMHSDPRSPTTAGRGATSNCACNMEKWERWSGPESERFEYKEGTVTADCDFDTVDEFVAPPALPCQRRCGGCECRILHVANRVSKLSIACVTLRRADKLLLSVLCVETDTVRYHSDEHSLFCTDFLPRRSLIASTGTRNPFAYAAGHGVGPRLRNGRNLRLLRWLHQTSTHIRARVHQHACLL